MYKVFVSFKLKRGVYETDQVDPYEARMDGARQFLNEHQLTRDCEDPRQALPVNVSPSWLVNHGFVHLRRKDDRRYRYGTLTH